MICRFCGSEKSGIDFNVWVKPTFTDHDLLLPGDSVCNDCLFWFEEASADLQSRTGKDKPQRMRNYSHFVVNGEWVPLSKGDKARMLEMLTSLPFPEMAAIADSGQKHIVFRAVRNAPGSRAGWVQFEEQRVWIEPDSLCKLVKAIEGGLIVFSKAEIESGQYIPHRIMQFGIAQWQALEAELKPSRGSLFFQVAVFLSQRKEIEDAGNGGGSAGNSLAGDRRGVQKSGPPDDMGTIREHGQGRSVHEQSRKIHQLSMFET